MKEEIFIFLTVFFVLITINTASATRIYVDPSSIEDPSLTPGKNFSVDAKLEDVSDLYAWQVKVYFDPNIIKCTDVIFPPGHVFEGKTYIPVIKIDNETGYVKSGAALYPDSTFSGSGILCRFNFIVSGTGISELNFSRPYGEDIYLLNSSFNIIPDVQLEDGYFKNSEMTTTTTTLSDGTTTTTMVTTTSTTEGPTTTTLSTTTTTLPGGTTTTTVSVTTTTSTDGNFGNGDDEETTTTTVTTTTSLVTTTETGGSTTTSITPACEENWVCTEWSECVDGSQTRTCTDLNECGTVGNKPEESRGCGSGDIMNYIPYIILIIVSVVAVVILVLRFMLSRTTAKQTSSTGTYPSYQ